MSLCIGRDLLPERGAGLLIYSQPFGHIEFVEIAFLPIDLGDPPGRLRIDGRGGELPQGIGIEIDIEVGLPGKVFCRDVEGAQPQLDPIVHDLAGILPALLEAHGQGL
jgi:hypothetical protein